MTGPTHQLFVSNAEQALPYPGDEPGQLTALRERLYDSRQALAHAYDLLSDARAGLAAAWYGDEADAATGEVACLIHSCDQAVQYTDDAAGAVSDHLVTLYQVRARVDALREEWTPLQVAHDEATFNPLSAQKYCDDAGPAATFGFPVPDIHLRHCSSLDDATAELLDILESRLGDILDRWRIQVQVAEDSASTCRNMLDSRSTGGPMQGPGLEGKSIDLAGMLGIDGLVFDDRSRSLFGSDRWNGLSATQQKYYLTLARTEMGQGPAPTGAALSATWADLDPLSRQALLHDDPARWGNADGIPASDRDQANRIVLADDVADIRARTTGVQPPLPPADKDPARYASAVTASLLAAGYSGADLQAARGALAVHFQLGRATAHPTDGAPVQLLIYQPAAFDGQGRAAIAIGDVATADNVAMLVPGITSNVPDYLRDQTDDAFHLFDAATADSAASTAVVSYIGYRAPGSLLDAADQDLSDAGAPVVARDISGLRLMRTSAPGHLTIVAHSYGSTTAATAFARDGVGDGGGTTDLVLIGSPGAGRAGTAADLGLPDDHVWVGSASSDPVTTSAQLAQQPGVQEEFGCGAAGIVGAIVGGLLGGPAGAAGGFGIGCGAGAVAAPAAAAVADLDVGNDPAGQGFGGTRFAAETRSDMYVNLDNHSQYYDRHTESLANIAHIVIGDYSEVTTVPTRPEHGGHFSGADPAAAHEPVYPAPGG